ncbi:MAG TPA: T9SS type A sorting domain-containing protein [Hymenobacter sp.]
MKTFTRYVALLMCLLWFSNPAKAQFNVSSASYLGDETDADQVKGSRIQSDGTIVLAANIGKAKPGNVAPTLLNNAAATASGAIIRLSTDGRTVLSVTRLAEQVYDLALDGSDNIFVAAGTAGIIKLTPNAGTVTWNRLSGSYVHRVDAASDGTSVALVPTNVNGADLAGGAGRITAFDKGGAVVVGFTGYSNTQDVCLDAASRTVITVGWRQANAFDGSRNEPVQISYLRGYGYNERIKWANYDWSVDRASPRFINKPENNMADTRGVRCTMGRDGKLYAAYECAGGNHIFRYSPADIAVKTAIVGGDQYHDFSNTRSEDKTFFARYEPATGAYLRGQQLVNRLGSGVGNTILARDLAADETGRVCIGGASAFGLPSFSLNPPGLGPYTGGAWFMVMSTDFTQRLFVTRLNASGQTFAMDARTINGKASIVWAGQAKTFDAQYVLNAVQPTAGGGSAEGFFAVIGSAAALSSAAGNNAGAALELFPNPTRNQFFIGYETQQRGPVQVEITDALGRPAMAAFERVAQAGTNRFAVALPTLPLGLYVVRVRQGSAAFTQKLVLAN